MGLFDGFLRRIFGLRPPRSLQRICYDMAYTALPYCAFNNGDKLISMFTDGPIPVGTFYYVTVCQALKINIVREDAKLFRQHCGKLDDAHDYYIVEYPTPPPVDLSNIDMGSMPVERIPVLAPYFSAVVRHRETKRISYFTLGQASMGGGTTLRAVTPDNSNLNFGKGPEPRLDAFLATLRRSR